ncbi:MAG: SIS domain-containing protein, partial [Candidatus Aenigmarchaeota archaeon]|nr:SIS domain-containing protein [Candidatus Aenigmarchaeota archaeon]
MLGDPRPFKILTKGLSLLNYRGYDSKGLAIITDFHRDGLRLEIEKMVNDDVNNIRDRYLSKNKYHDRFMHVGIAHNRWATHGGVTVENAHPHTDCRGEIAVVHNGIIDNYLELYEKYPGHIIRSETDSEIIPHLIEEYMKNGLDFENAFKSAVYELKGTLAILAVNVKEPDILMAARQDSPLIIGLGDYENFVSSDIMSLLEFTDRFIRLEDGDVAKIGKYSVGEGTIKIYNNGEIVKREIKKIEEIPEGWFENTQYHLVTEDGELWPDITLNEMEQQRETMISALDQDKENISKIIEMLKSAEKIILTGAGSSYNAAIGGEFLFCELGYDARAISACDLERYEKIIDEETAVIALSQSGETMDIIQPLKKIKSEKNPKIISMVNVPFSTISEEIADLNIPLNCGAERAVAATKSFTSQQILLRYLYYGLDGRLDEGENIIKTAIEKIPRYRYDSPFRDYDDLSTYLSQTNQIIILGEGINYS